MAVLCFSCLSPDPCHLRALCAVVQRLDKGHQVRAEASLSPAAGTHCAAACFVACSHRKDCPLGPTQKKLWSPALK